MYEALWIGDDDTVDQHTSCIDRLDGVMYFRVFAPKSLGERDESYVSG
jgi:hypothetical protein